MKILKVVDYTIPMCGNKRINPYGKLLVTDGTTQKVVSIKDEKHSPYQYFTFNRKKYYITRFGLYSPVFTITGSMEYVIEMLKECRYKFEILSEKALRIFYKDSSGDYCGLQSCDDPRPGYYMIAGRVQNFTDWLYNQR
jgi:hypothetical protein